jgi:hypothetical protein
VTTKQDKKKFMAEFEALKAKYGEEFADLKVVRFTTKEGKIVRDWEDYVPYSCTYDGETGEINCEEERPI